MTHVVPCGLPPPPDDSPIVVQSDLLPATANRSHSAQSRLLSYPRPHQHLALLQLALAFLAFPVSSVLAQIPIDFARDVLPIFRDHCHECHGPEMQKAGYRLDLRDAALRGGDSGQPALVPHNPNESPLFQLVAGIDPDRIMPPPKSGKSRLSTPELDVLRRWIESGPAWPDSLAGQAQPRETLWSLRPLTTPPVPDNHAHPVDAFIAAKLREKSHDLAPEADRRTLARRLSYTLTGLPPSPADLDAFLADSSPTAYRSLVDRWLASPAYGEHWARHWLDVASYADTHGNDHDYIRPNAWPYRDYLIHAFNNDKPYARFAQEQIAGDVLFPEDPQATVALGFLAANPWDHTLMVSVREDTVDHRIAQNLDRDAMVSATIGTFNSLTVHCARCHDHKFDPISQREYYSLQAVFAGVDRADRPFGPDADSHRTRERLRAEKWAIEHRDPSLIASLDTPERIREFAAWEEKLAEHEKAWLEPEILSVVSTGGATLNRQDDGSWFASGKRPDRDTYILTARWPDFVPQAFRLEVLPDDRLPQKGPGRWDNGNFHLSEFRAFASTNSLAGAQSAVSITIARATADYNEGPAISAAQAIDGKNETHWGIHPRYGEPHEAVFELQNSAALTAGTLWTFLLEHQANTPGHGIGRFRLTATAGKDPGNTSDPVPLSLRQRLKVPPHQRTPEQRQELALQFLAIRNAQALAVLPKPNLVYAITRDFAPDGPNFKPSPYPRPIHILSRGDLARPGDKVSPGSLHAIPSLPGDWSLPPDPDEADRRAALARWIADPRNVLTWRSIVNRVWAWHFGRGLCDTPNDFGHMGGSPSHPELLDWLAVWFRDQARGSFKALHQLILTSATWKQASQAPTTMADDADNRLLWRQNRLRLTAEQVRDSLLVLSGRLDPALGGPPAIQFIERGNATFNPGGNPPFVDYEHFDSDAPAARRRSVYRFIFRTVPDPFMDALDSPDGSTFTPTRAVSTTAVQAFAMLNDPFLIRQSQHIASRLASHNPSPRSQAEAAYRHVLLRAPKPIERDRFAAYSQIHGLANATHWLLNGNEFLYLD